MSAGDRSQCPKTFHGTYNAYLYGCRCDDAREVARLYVKRRRHGVQPPATMPVVGSTRRVQALIRIGYTPRYLSLRIGRHSKCVSEISLAYNPRVLVETHRQIVRVYDELCMTPGPSVRAMLLGERKGYAPPLCWSDETIDDPTAEPEGVATGKRKGKLPPAEDIQYLIDSGSTVDAIAQRFGTRTNTVEQALQRAKRSAA